MDINFEDLFEKKILKRGYDYYLEDAVHDVTRDGNHYEALVYGTDIYEVEIDINNEGQVQNMECECPYAIGDNCKHMAALLYYIANDEIIENKKISKNKNSYENIIKNIPDSEIKEFVLQKLYDDRYFKNEFRSFFAQYFEKAPKSEYKKRIEQSIYNAIGRKGFIEYDETDRFSAPMYDYIQEAQNYIKHYEYQIPFWIASIILEHLPNLPIDDSDGTTSYVESLCIEVLEDIMQNCKDENIIEEIFKWILNSIKNNTLGDYSYEVENILDEYYDDKRYIKDRLQIIEEKITTLKEDEDSYYYKYEIEDILKTKVSLLQKIGEEEKALETIKENIKYTEIRKMLINIEYENGNLDKVEKLLKDGIKNAIKENYYGTAIDFVDKLLELYFNQNETEKYKGLLNDALFKYSRGNYKYYKKLKELYLEEEWKKERDSIIQELEKKEDYLYRDDLRQIYIEEQYFDKLYKSVTRYPTYEVMLKYEEYLIEHYEKEILQVYEKIIDEQAQYAVKKNYQYIGNILRHIKTLKNGKEFVRNKIEEYKTKYANRPLMMEELNNIILKE